MDKEIRKLLIIGGKELRKLKDDDFLDFLNFFDSFAERIEKEEERKLKEKEKARLMKLILGIMKKYGAFDERYHLHLVGRLLRG